MGMKLLEAAVRDKHGLVGIGYRIGIGLEHIRGHRKVDGWELDGVQTWNEASLAKKWTGWFGNTLYELKRDVGLGSLSIRYMPRPMYCM